MNVSREFHAHAGNYTPGGNSCRYIVVHNTGNTASARSEASYAQNDQHESSYHYVLDGSECYQVLDDTDTAWAVGAWRGCTQYIGNGESISIEVCSDGVPFTDAEVSMLSELVQTLMQRHGIDGGHVVRHRDCHSGHKDCPAAYVDDGAWQALKARIVEGTQTSGSEEEEMQVIIHPSAPKDMGNALYYFNGSEIYMLSSPDQATALDMVSTAVYGHAVKRYEMNGTDDPWFSRLVEACGGVIHQCPHDLETIRYE